MKPQGDKAYTLTINPKQDYRSKATLLFEAILASLPAKISLLARMSPAARMVSSIPDEAVDKAAPRIIDLLNEWYNPEYGEKFDADHQPDTEPA